MARGSPLTRRSLVALAACLGLAIAGHWVVLACWDGQAAGTGPALQRMPDPVFARLLAPAENPPAGRTAPAAPARKPVTTDVSALALPVETSSTPPATPPAAPASSPAPAASSPESPAQADTAASAPAPAASSPASAPAQSQTVADAWPPDARLTYKLEGRWRSGPLYGSARVQWQRQGTQYQAQVEIDIPPFAHRALTSQGEITPQGLAPRVYEERSRTRRRAMRLDDAQVTLADGRGVPRPPEVQDTASQFVELGHRFATGRQTLAMGEVVTVWLARPGGVDLWTYDVVAQDRVAIPRQGEVMAWRLRPRPMTTRTDNISAEIWFAPSLRYLPVRIRLALGDEAEIDLKVETVEQR